MTDHDGPRPLDPRSIAVLEFEKIRRRLADHTSFSGGRALALAVAPSTDADEVRARLQLAAEAMQVADRKGRPPFGGAHDMRPEVEAAERGRVLLPAELVDISDTLRAARSVRNSLVRGAALWPALGAIAQSLDESPALADALREALDDDAQILDSASPALRKIRAGRRTAHDRLLRQLNTILTRAGVRQYLQEPIVTQRAGRYVIPVKSDFRGKVPGVVHDTSDSGATLFVEPLALVEAGNRHRELEIEEEKEVARILRELSGLVAAEAPALRDTIEALSRLDLVFATAEMAHDMRATIPEITPGRPALHFDRARHPLLDRDSVVPIDVRVGGDFRLLVITGPNTGGKTVALKTIGLLTLMTQAGLPIPCSDGARLGVFDAIWADIGDEQSIEQSLSTFSGHLTNIVRMLGDATEDSLVILDELGAGTDPTEGAALAVAILDTLRERGCATVASTHYSELKSYAYDTPGVMNASVEFDVQSLSPTYELAIGLPGRSNALAIASRLGLDSRIVDAARAAVGEERIALEDMLADIRSAEQEAKADRAIASADRARADEWAVRLQAALVALETERETVLARARAEAAAELEAARRLASHLETEARAAGRKPEAEAIAEVVVQASAAAAEAEALAHAVPPPTIATGLQGELPPGTPVRVPGLADAGEIVEWRGDGMVEVAVGRLRMTLPARQLEHVPDAPVVGAPTRRRTSKAPVTRISAPPHASEAAPRTPLMELDLRGQRVEEALEKLDRHLDRAVLSGAPWVHVIHGHGTGAMKKAVRDLLAAHPQVESFRPGAQGEGGDGVTVVQLT